jgi:hypothetical protein
MEDGENRILLSDWQLLKKDPTPLSVKRPN